MNKIADDFITLKSTNPTLDSFLSFDFDPSITESDFATHTTATMTYLDTTVITPLILSLSEEKFMHQKISFTKQHPHRFDFS